MPGEAGATCTRAGAARRARSRRSPARRPTGSGTWRATGGATSRPTGTPRPRTASSTWGGWPGWPATMSAGARPPRLDAEAAVGRGPAARAAYPRGDDAHTPAAVAGAHRRAVARAEQRGARVAAGAPAPRRAAAALDLDVDAAPPHDPARDLALDDDARAR